MRWAILEALLRAGAQGLDPSELLCMVSGILGLQPG